MNKVYYIFLFLFAGLYESPAQQIKGFITDPLNQDTLFNVTVFNQSKNLSTYSDASGSFQIMANLGDTIHFLLDGYYPRQIQIRKHHFWDHLYIQLSRHTILLDSEKLMQESWRQIVKKHRKPLPVAGLTQDEDAKKTVTRSSFTIIYHSTLKSEIMNAYQLTDEQLDRLIIMFHKQQNTMLIDKNDREIISHFLQYVEAKTRQRP